MLLNEKSTKTLAGRDTGKMWQSVARLFYHMPGTVIYTTEALLSPYE